MSPDEELQRDAAAEIVAGVPLLERRSPVWWDCQPLPHWRGEADEWEALLPPDGFRTLRRWYNAMPLCPDPDRPEWPSWAEVLESLPSSHPVTTGDLRSLHGWLVERLGDAEAPRLAWERVIERLQTVGEQNRATRERWADEKAVAAQKARCRRRRDRAAELAPALRRIAERIADAQGLVVQRVDGLELVLMHPDEPPTIRAPDGTRQPAPWLADAQRGVEMYREQALCLLSEAPACEPAGERS